MKQLLFKQRGDRPHWVGDGFPVRTIFDYEENGKALSPFLLMDYFGPTEFSPSTHKRGVGAHPHRGFETVTIMYDGEVEHKDSHGGGGIVEAGDVQWMTAASGIIHEEFHGRNLTLNGGKFWGIQLWVNLPKKDKMTSPRYQDIRSNNIPVATLPDGAGSVRVIAGNFQGQQGPAATFTPINLWDIHLTIDHNVEFKVPAGHTSAIFVANGELILGDGQTLAEAEVGVLEPEGESFTLRATRTTRILFLGGEPLNEPIAGQGPFVMNTYAEIGQAISDYKSGKMGIIKHK